MKKYGVLLLFVVGLAWATILCTGSGESQATADPSLVSMERNFSGREFSAERFGPARWLEDGSGGGQMSLNMIFRYPELYNTAMVIAFVSVQRLCDTIYQERYMGLPDDNQEGYTNGSPITHAHNLRGNLLIVHGIADDNVHYQSFERLIN